MNSNWKTEQLSDFPCWIYGLQHFSYTCCWSNCQKLCFTHPALSRCEEAGFITSFDCNKIRCRDNNFNLKNSVGASHLAKVLVRTFDINRRVTSKASMGSTCFVCEKLKWNGKLLLCMSLFSSIYMPLVALSLGRVWLGFVHPHSQPCFLGGWEPSSCYWKSI